MFDPGLRRSLRGFALAAVAAMIPLSAQAQVGQIAGTVVHADSGEPVSAVQISVEGTGLGTITTAEGTFTLTNVPAGTRAVVAQRLGFQQTRQGDVTVTAGQTITINLQLRPTVLQLQEIVATGLIDPVEGVRSPISVAVVTRESMPVTVAGSAIQNLQGRVAGLSMNRTSGQPGEDVTIMLRSPTSSRITGGGNEPLIVVDGVILGSGTTNIESLDIETIEVVRGAAAASLYGSQAAAGVISITTARGQNLALGQTRFIATTEFGYSTPFTSKGFPTHHPYRVDDPVNPTTYLNLAGEPVGRDQRVFDGGAFAFMDNPYPGPIYDNVKTIFQPGNYARQSIQMQANHEATNLAITLARSHDAGPLENNDGYTMHNLRVNVDHRFRNALSLGVSAYHSRDHRDGIESTFATMLGLPPDIDLSRKDANGEYVRVPDPEIAIENPLWRQLSREDDRWRVRTLASASLRWNPASWVNFMTNFSYDRQDTKNRAWTPKGTPISPDEEDPSLSNGSMSFSSSLSDRWNYEAQVSFRRSFGSVNARTSFRAILERSRNEAFSVSGNDFLVSGVPQIDQLRSANRTGASSESETLAEGYLGNLALEAGGGKYIAEGLLRYDGSSLFGPDNRWHPYYRTAFAWRMGEEDWFNVPNVSEFKLSYSRGTAGGRPAFSNQYETWNVSQGGVISKTTLGNRELGPETTTENNFTLEMILANRFGIELTHARQKTEDQIVLALLPAFTGYPSGQWSNGGTVTGTTWELTLEGQLIQRPTFNWTSMFVFDRSQGQIEEWPFACRSEAWRFRCPGAGIYEIHGFRFLDAMSQLERHHAGALTAYADQFMMNDDGFVVWVGEGRHYTEPGLWGTQTSIEGVLYDWGMPFREKDENGDDLRGQMGDASHTNFGWINNFQVGRFGIHAHFSATVGGQGVNTGFQGMLQNMRYPNMDQSSKPEQMKKPLPYYTVAIYSGAAGSTYFLEDASYLKLRTASVTYSVTPQQLGRIGMGRLGIESLRLGLIGRNLIEFSSWSGWDPEQALNLQSRNAAAGTPYPNTRQFTFEAQVQF